MITRISTNVTTASAAKTRPGPAPAAGYVAPSRARDRARLPYKSQMTAAAPIAPANWAGTYARRVGPREAPVDGQAERDRGVKVSAGPVAEAGRQHGEGEAAGDRHGRRAAGAPASGLARVAATAVLVMARTRTKGSRRLGRGGAYHIAVHRVAMHALNVAGRPGRGSPLASACSGRVRIRHSVRCARLQPGSGSGRDLAGQGHPVIICRIGSGLPSPDPPRLRG